MKKTISLFIASSIVLAFLSFTSKTTIQKPWAVPDASKNKVNPLKGDAASVATGKTLYTQHCKSCHGTKGKGDGPKAAQLDTESGDFTNASFQSQTDGALFYKTSVGRDDMPSYKKKNLQDNEIWAMVNYMRTFK